jgi:hypothetical protein
MRDAFITVNDFSSHLDSRYLVYDTTHIGKSPTASSINIQRVSSLLEAGEDLSER